MAPPDDRDQQPPVRHAPTLLSTPPAPGPQGLFAGRYTLGRRLREGSSSVYFEATIGDSGERVLLKTLLPGLARDEACRARMRRELAIIRSLQHPCIIPVREVGATAEGVPFAVLDPVEGRSLTEVMAREGVFSMDRLRPILGQVGGALAELHGKGVVHRDLRPDNLLVTDAAAGERAWLIGLELARHFAVLGKATALSAEHTGPITQRGTVLGSPRYMSPEQFMGKDLDARSDIYSLGVSVYELLSGDSPFAAATPWEWATQHITAAPPSLQSRGVQVSPPVEQAIGRAIAKQPEERPASVAEFLALLRAG
jgi:serine/threonine-protein kinase